MIVLKYIIIYFISILIDKSIKLMKARELIFGLINETEYFPPHNTGKFSAGKAMATQMKDSAVEPKIG